jgi:hypothetical protein
VCRDFHTADLAWTARVMSELAPPSESPLPAPARGGIRQFVSSGVVRLENDHLAAIFRTRKLPRNTQFGGAVGAGLCHVWRRDGGDGALLIDRETALCEGQFTVHPRHPQRLAAVRRFLRDNPPGREGRQWLFVARLLGRHGRPVAAVSRLWRGWLRPALQALTEPATTHFGVTSMSETSLGDGGLTLRCQPAYSSGAVPKWGEDVVVERTFTLERDRLAVVDRLAGGDTLGAIDYVLPSGATDVSVDAQQALRREGPGAQRLHFSPSGAPVSVTVRYRL